VTDLGHHAASLKPHIVLLYCSRCVTRTPSTTPATVHGDGCSVLLDMLPCSSKVETSHLLRIIEQGADGVEVVCCPVGACQCIDGNVRADKRIEYARRFLGQIGIGADRLGLTHGAALSVDDLVGFAAKRAQAVAPLGANPMKGEHTL